MKITMTEKTITLHVEDRRDGYDIMQAAHKRYYDRKKVEASLKYDGWGSLEEAEVPECEVEWYLDNRCRESAPRKLTK